MLNHLEVSFLNISQRLLRVLYVVDNISTQFLAMLLKFPHFKSISEKEKETLGGKKVKFLN